MKSEKANILGIAPYRFLPVINGGHKAIEQLYRYLGERRQTIVVSTENNDKHLATNFTLIPLFAKTVLRYANVFYYKPLQNIIQKNNITHLIVEHPYMGWLGVLLQKSTGVKLCVRSHNIESLRFKSLHKKWWKLLFYYERKIHQQADLNFFITDEDRAFAITNFRLHESRCKLLTYGISQSSPPTDEAKKEARRLIETKHSISPSQKILLFNGDLGYAPNAEAVDIIINQINPLLLQRNFSYVILLCGRGLSQALLDNIKQNRNIIYAGFVPDVLPYFLAADVFINPVVTGGGIKTKLVEALGANGSAVSTVNGALGIPVETTGEKLTVVDNNNWLAFANAIVESNNVQTIPGAFYRHFYWGQIADSVINNLEEI